MPRTVARLIVGLLAALFVLTACGVADGESDDGGAAEPERGPEADVDPAGRVAQVAPKPQGIAYDEATDSLAVAVRDSFRLLVIDPTSLEIRREVVLTGKARHLQTNQAGGVALVPSEDADALFEVDLATGEFNETRVRDYPHDAAGAANGDVAVANEFDGSISIVRDQETVHVFDDLTQPGGVVIQGRTLAVVDVEEWEVSAYDLDSLERTGRLPAGNGPTHAAVVGENKIAVTDTRGDSVRLFSLNPLSELGEIELEGGPYGIAGDPETETAWVTTTGNNQVTGLDVSGDVPAVIESYPTVQQPDTVAVAPGSGTLWVAGTATGEIQRIKREETQG